MVQESNLEDVMGFKTAHQRLSMKVIVLNNHKKRGCTTEICLNLSIELSLKILVFVYRQPIYSTGF